MDCKFSAISIPSLVYLIPTSSFPVGRNFCFCSILFFLFVLQSLFLFTCQSAFNLLYIFCRRKVL